MLDRNVIEKILTVNGVEPSAPDETIKSVLLSARWHEQDVETALMVLKKNNKTDEQKIDTLHKIFRSDERLKPETITSLLGINTQLPLPTSVNQGNPTREVSRAWIWTQVTVVTLILTGGLLVFCMWYWQFGLFHYSFTEY